MTLPIGFLAIQHGDSHYQPSRREQLVFTSVSNVLKLRHDTAKNSIGN
jgi:hypothetical protein